MINTNNIVQNKQILFSILTVSRSADNINIFLESIAKSISISFGMVEILCSWNGDGNEENRILIPNNINFKIIDKSPYHFATNTNTLAKQASGKYLCIANDDIEFNSETISNSLKWLNYPNIGIVGSILLFPNGKIQHCGVSFKPDMTPFHIDKGLNFYGSKYTYAPRVVEACTGALFFCQKKLYDNIQMKENFSECGEDICFSIDLVAKTGFSIVIPHDVIAEHKEGFTRSKLGKQGTPECDIQQIREHVKKYYKRKNSIISIETEEKGWIFYRMAEEIKRNVSNYNIGINDFDKTSDIIYFIHYARYDEKKAKNKISIANFTHYVPGTNAELLFCEVAYKIDHCIAISQATKKELIAIGISNDKITVIEIGAAKEFNPKITLGIVGRSYGDGRKSEDLVKRLYADKDICSVINLVSMDDSWGVKTLSIDSHNLFYDLIDFLLVPSRIEGGPVPFMEALACGKLSIAPPIGVIPSFPHISYDTGNYEDMKSTILQTAYDELEKLREIATCIKDKNWERWAFEHNIVFDHLLKNKLQKNFTESILNSTTLGFSSESKLSLANKLLRNGQYKKALNLYKNLLTDKNIPKSILNTNITISEAKIRKENL